jgi:hypothetical protein
MEKPNYNHKTLINLTLQIDPYTVLEGDLNTTLSHCLSEKLRKETNIHG